MHRNWGMESSQNLTVSDQLKALQATVYHSGFLSVPYYRLDVRIRYVKEQQEIKGEKKSLAIIRKGQKGICHKKY